VNSSRTDLSFSTHLYELSLNHPKEVALAHPLLTGQGPDLALVSTTEECEEILLQFTQLVPRDIDVENLALCREWRLQISKACVAVLALGWIDLASEKAH